MRGSQICQSVQIDSNYPSTGDPSCPPEVRLAKRVFKEIQDSVEIGDTTVVDEEGDSVQSQSLDKVFQKMSTGLDFEEDSISEDDDVEIVSDQSSNVTPARHNSSHDRATSIFQASSNSRSGPVVKKQKLSQPSKIQNVKTLGQPRPNARSVNLETRMMEVMSSISDNPMASDSGNSQMMSQMTMVISQLGSLTASVNQLQQITAEISKTVQHIQWQMQSSNNNQQTYHHMSSQRFPTQSSFPLFKSPVDQSLPQMNPQEQAVPSDNVFGPSFPQSHVDVPNLI